MWSSHDPAQHMAEYHDLGFPLFVLVSENTLLRNRISYCSGRLKLGNTLIIKAPFSHSCYHYSRECYSNLGFVVLCTCAYTETTKYSYKPEALFSYIHGLSCADRDIYNSIAAECYRHTRSRYLGYGRVQRHLRKEVGQHRSGQHRAQPSCIP